HRTRRSAGAVSNGARGSARRGTGDRENGLHAEAQGKAGQGEVAGGGRRQDPAREGGRGRRVGGDHRGQGTRGGDEARAAAEREGDRAAAAGGGGAQGAEDEGRRGRRRGAQDRVDRGGGFAAEAVGCRRVPHRGHGQGSERAAGPRFGADREEPAVDPEDPGRQAERQDPGDRRATGGGRFLRGRPDRHAAARPGEGGGRDSGH